jgi:hypothetical protein
MIIGERALRAELSTLKTSFELFLNRVVLSMSIAPNFNGISVNGRELTSTEYVFTSGERFDDVTFRGCPIVTMGSAATNSAVLGDGTVMEPDVCGTLTVSESDGGMYLTIAETPLIVAGEYIFTIPAGEYATLCGLENPPFTITILFVDAETLPLG